MALFQHFMNNEEIAYSAFYWDVYGNALLHVLMTTSMQTCILTPFDFCAWKRTLMNYTLSSSDQYSLCDTVRYIIQVGLCR